MAESPPPLALRAASVGEGPPATSPWSRLRKTVVSTLLGALALGALAGVVNVSPFLDLEIRRSRLYNAAVSVRTDWSPAEDGPPEPPGVGAQAARTGAGARDGAGEAGTIDSQAAVEGSMAGVGAGAGEVGDLDTSIERRATGWTPPGGARGGFVKKHVYSDKQRVVLVAGLEGTGHHYFEAAFLACQRNGMCAQDCGLSQGFYPGVALAPSLKDYERSVGGLEQTMGRLKAREDKHSEHKPLVVPLNCVGIGVCKGVGMMSFPNFGGPGKATQHINVPLMARMLEAHGLDFRIVYLDRKGEDLVASTVKRGFGSFMVESRVLADSAHVLLRQLEHVDPAFIECFSFEGFRNPGQARRIAEFVTPKWGNKVDDLTKFFVEAGKQRKPSRHMANPASAVGRAGRRPLKYQGPLGPPSKAYPHQSPAGELQLTLDIIKQRYCSGLPQFRGGGGSGGGGGGGAGAGARTGGGSAGAPS